MPAPTSSSGWVHWLESGPGARWLTRAAFVLGVLVLSFAVAMKQFRGPRSETTLAQAAVARQLAAGAGFTTPVNEPHVVAWFETRGVPFDPARPYPELRHAPLYPALLGGVLALLPEGVRTRWLSDLPATPDGFAGDYVLLGVNGLLLWGAVLLTWRLGVRLFSPAVGVVSAGALLLSAPVWTATVALNGTPLAMVIVLLIAHAWIRAVEARAAGGSGRLGWALAGAGCGALFLIDYTLGLMAPLVAGAAAWGRAPGRRVAPVLLVLGAALLVASPWLIRNVAIAGHPLGLAWQEVAWRAGDPTAEPEQFRRTFSAEAPAIDLRKLANKALTAVQSGVQADLWAGGLLFSAFFVAGWVYRFPHDAARSLRAGVTLALAGLTVARGLCDSGEGERLPALILAPLLIVFGTAFLQVLLASQPFWAARLRPAWVGVLVLQSLPLWQDVLEPRRTHFHYPPYHPGLLVELGDALHRGNGAHAAWMADIPAGAAWYSGSRVWWQPSSLRGFREVMVRQPVEALLLTPHTLDRPFFADLNRPTVEASRFGDWGRIYVGLIDERLPADFPLPQHRRIADNVRLMSVPGALRPTVKSLR